MVTRTFLVMEEASDSSGPAAIQQVPSSSKQPTGSPKTVPSACMSAALLNSNMSEATLPSSQTTSPMALPAAAVHAATVPAPKVPAPTASDAAQAIPAVPAAISLYMAPPTKCKCLSLPLLPQPTIEHSAADAPRLLVAGTPILPP